VKIYFFDGNAFVEMAEGYLVYIGTAEEIKALTPIQLLDLLKERNLWRKR